MKLPTFILLAIITAWARPDARAQLGETNLDGLCINVPAIYRVGDARDLDCIVNLEFTGENAAGAVKMSQVRVIQAFDDTGADLVRTNPQHYQWGTSPPLQRMNGFSQTIDLKTPSADALAIKLLEGEAEIFMPTVNPPTFTDFPEHSGGVLRHALLEQYQVKLSYQIHELTNGLIIPPEKKIEFQVDDPGGNLAGLVLQKADGTLIRALSISTSASDPHFTSILYNLSGVPARDLKLQVNLAVPESTRKIRFKVENIRLPWFDPIDLKVTATDVTRMNVQKTNQSACRLLLTFAGGQAAGSAGIRDLFVSRAESDAGQSFKIKEDAQYWMTKFSPLVDDSGSGQHASKWLPLEIATNNVKSIRILEGEAELYFPCVTNGGVLDFNDFLSHAGEPLHDDALGRCGVKITYWGRDNFAIRRKDWVAHRITFVSILPPGQWPENISNSLLFGVDDPEKRVIKFEFLNQKGEPLQALTQMNSSEAHSLNSTNCQLYAFHAPPPDGTQLRIYLAAPESLERVKFKVENIPL